MSDSPLTFAIFSLDIIPEIASSLPLYIKSSTLLALALTNRRLKEIIIPRLLYQRMWLQGEDRTFAVLDKLRTQPARAITEQDNAVLGTIVRRLSIASELSTTARGRETSVIREFHKLLEVGALRNLISLFLHLSHGWYHDDQYWPISTFGRLDRSFWDSLKIGCPRLAEFSLSGVHEWDDKLWIDQSGLFDFQVRRGLPGHHVRVITLPLEPESLWFRHQQFGRSVQTVIIPFSVCSHILQTMLSTDCCPGYWTASQSPLLASTHSPSALFLGMWTLRQMTDCLHGTSQTCAA
jgi:hypothetical protein